MSQSDSYTALYYACRDNDLKFVKDLIHHKKEKVDEPIERKSTVLMFAIFQGYLDIADFLIKSGANINHQDMNGHCPLTMAIRSGRIKTVEFLIHQKHINLALIDAEGKYPLQHFNINSSNNDYRKCLALKIIQDLLAKKVNKQQTAIYLDSIKKYILAVGTDYITDQTEDIVMDSYVKLKQYYSNI